MGTRERRQREREELRGKVLDAARELFATDGWEAVTMRRIAERIEYSPTAIYLHFRDKQAVLRALCDADFLALAQRLAKIARIADPIARLRATGMAYAEFALAHPNHYRLMFMTPHPPQMADESELERGNPEEDAYAFLRGIVAEAIAGGLLRRELDDVEAVTQLMWAGVHGVVSLHLAKCNDAWVDWRPPLQLVDTMITVLVRGIGAAAAPAAKPSPRQRPRLTPSPARRAKR